MTDYVGEHEAPEDATTPWLSTKAYDALKYVALIVLPALATFYLTFGQLWDFPATEKVAASIVAFDTFLGLLLRLSSKSYDKSDAKYDGTIVVQNPDDGPKVYSLEVNTPLSDIDQSKQLLFKVDKPS